MELKQIHKTGEARKAKRVFILKPTRKFKDEKHVVFTTSLGAVIGEAMINKADIPLIKEFGKKSRFTQVFVK